MLVALGDSLTRGSDGYRDLFTDAYPQVLTKIIHQRVINQGVDGAMISHPFLGDLSSQIHNTHFPQYDGAILFFGTNDYGHSHQPLESVAKILKKNLQWIRKNYPIIKLWGILPLTRYDNLKNDDHVKCAAGYTFQELLKTLAHVYQVTHVPFLNWEADTQPLVTDQNFKTRLNDHHVHPTKETYHLMAKRIAKFIQKTN